MHGARQNQPPETPRSPADYPRQHRPRRSGHRRHRKTAVLALLRAGGVSPLESSWRTRLRGLTPPARRVGSGLNESTYTLKEGTQVMKAGWKTSEFWIALVTKLLAVLCVTGVIRGADEQHLTETATKAIMGVFSILAAAKVV